MQSRAQASKHKVWPLCYLPLHLVLYHLPITSSCIPSLDFLQLCLRHRRIHQKTTRCSSYRTVQAPAHTVHREPRAVYTIIQGVGRFTAYDLPPLACRHIELPPLSLPSPSHSEGFAMMSSVGYHAMLGWSVMICPKRCPECFGGI